MSSEVFILGGKRTPMGEYVGALKDVSAIDLGAVAARGALEATGVRADDIDHTVIGNALQTSGDAIYGARHVGLKAGVPNHVPALTVNRLCGSGIQSVISAAEQIEDRKSTRLNSSHANISYAVFCLKKNPPRSTSFR